MKNVTISDIALKAEVSKATVSRVLNSPEKVDEGTRRKIEQIMKDLNYTPSAAARSLSKQVSSTVGVIVPEISNSFFGEMFAGIEEITNRNHLSLLYCSNDDDEKKDLTALDLMRTQRVRGVLYVPAVNYEAYGRRRRMEKELERLGCPVICMDRDIGFALDTIHFDDRTAMARAVESLAEKGHTRIAIINGNGGQNVLASERYAGYLDGLEAAGIPLDMGLVFHGEYTRSYAYRITKELLEREEQPTAVITCNNSLGRGYLQAVYEAGRAKTFTHVSLDRIEMLDILGIPLNYIKRDSHELGRRAAELLISRIAFPERNVQNILLEAPLVRESY